MSAEPPGKDARRPVRIGKYEVLAHIATGGMGAVYKARDTDLGREVALKVLPLNLAAKPGTLDRFRREARSAAKLRHENIVAIYEFAEANGVHYLAMEFVDGVDLHDYISRRGKLKPELARQILIQAARALAHAHAQGIVHRDIKPSNFLITQRDGRPLVKLTDLGLARETSENESRLTRDGSTVGTVDYMAPEQARDSGSADIRSDIYSLGCTFYHMLAGNCPFPEGSLVERIYKHVEAAPPDVRRLSPEVPQGLAAILRRMLAKKPADRYQTPQELLRDLEAPETAAARPELLDDPGKGAGTKGRPPSSETRARRGTPSGSETAAAKKSPTSAETKAARKKRPKDDEGEGERKRRRKPTAKGGLPPWWPWVAGVAGAVLTIAVVVVIVVTSGEAPPEAPPAEVAKKDDTKDRTPAEPKPPQDKGDPGAKGPKKPDAAEQARLRAEVAGPLAEFPEPPADAAAVRVSRAAPSGPESFRTLAEACAAAPAGRHTVIEIHDNGPLFEPSVPVVKGRSLTVRAGPGYRPLLAWEGAGGAADRFLTVDGGSLAVENLDFVLRWAGDSAERPAAVCAVAGGDVAARGCTFSVAGRHPRGVQAVLLERQTEPARCRLVRCFLRGDALTAVAVRDAGADVLLDGCLFVATGEPPLLDLRCGAGGQCTLRVVRSTLAAGRTLLRADLPSGSGGDPAVRCLCLDAVLAHSGAERGDMVRLAGEGGVGRLGWKAVNSIYAGWARLLAAPGQEVPGGSEAAWRKLWGAAEAGRVLRSLWPEGLPSRLEERAPAALAATAGPALPDVLVGKGPVGCDPDAVPAGRVGWADLTADRPSFLALAKGLPHIRVAPPILSKDDSLYYGEEITLDGKTDLGDLLRKRLQDRKAARRVVLRVSGSGLHRTKPIWIGDAHLVLYVEPPKGKAKPLTLAPSSAAEGKAALIEVVRGSLEMTGVRVDLDDAEGKSMPHCAVRVQGGLQMLDCHLQGPRTAAAPDFAGLVVFEGSGKEGPEAAHECVLHRCVLVSAGAALTVRGAGARPWLENCVLLGPDDGLRFDLGTTAVPWLNVNCTLKHNTIAAGRAAVHVKDDPKLPARSWPVILQAEANAFLAPFAGEPKRAVLLLTEGDALARGGVLWKGKGNGYDVRRLHAYAAEEGVGPGPQAHPEWARLWGKAGEQQPLPLEWPRTPEWVVNPDRPQLDRLHLPPPARGRVGADLEKLGVPKKR